MSDASKKDEKVARKRAEAEASLAPAALYVRAACFTQAILDEQREALERYAEQNNLRVVRRYIEGGLPDKMRDELMKAVSSGSAGFAVIVMRDISRWGRFSDPDETTYYEYLCRNAGIDVRYAQEHQDTAGRNEKDLSKAVRGSFRVHER